jgi:hypothetical protein
VGRCCSIFHGHFEGALVNLLYRNHCDSFHSIVCVQPHRDKKAKAEIRFSRKSTALGSDCAIFHRFISVFPSSLQDSSFMCNHPSSKIHPLLPIRRYIFSQKQPEHGPDLFSVFFVLVCEVKPQLELSADCNNVIRC